MYVFSTHVLSEDTISRSVIDGKLHTKRLLIKTKWMPKWAKRITNVNVEKIIEESIVDPKEKVITTYTRNIGMVRILVCIFSFIKIYNKWIRLEHDVLYNLQSEG